MDPGNLVVKIKLAKFLFKILGLTFSFKLGKILCMFVLVSF